MTGMDSCHQWFADDFLHRRGFTLTANDNGSRTATDGAVTFPLSGPCDHPAEQCPPHTAAGRMEAAA